MDRSAWNEGVARNPEVDGVFTKKNRGPGEDSSG
jgi:hypothetical protein